MRITSKEILNEPVAPILVRMTVPMVISMFMMILFQAVDTYFVSLLGTVQLAAISFTFPVIYTIISMVVGLGIATSVMLASTIGQGDQDRARRITTENILLTVLLIAVISALGLVTVDPLFRWLGATEQTLPYIHDYMDVWYLFVGFMVLPMIGNSAIRATGDTKWPSIMMIVTGILNAILDPLLIFGLGPFPELAVRGAAYASVISWLFGFAISFWIIHHRERLLMFMIPDIRELGACWMKLIKLAMPISLANMLNPIAAAILTALVARYGEHAVAGFGAGNRIEALLLVVSFAMTASLSPYMAQNLGARKFDRAKTALRLSMRFAFCFNLALYPLVVLFAGPLAGVFTDDPAVLEVAKTYLYIMPVGICFYGVLIVINTAFNSAHKTKMTLATSLFRVVVCVAPLAWLGGELMNIPGLFIGAVLGNGIATIISWLVLRRIYSGLERDAAIEREQPGEVTTGKPEANVIESGTA